MFEHTIVMGETGREFGNGACCLCLSEDESTFHTNSVIKSRPLHEMVAFCIGIQVNVTISLKRTEQFEKKCEYFLWQINTEHEEEEEEDERIFSTLICNECVLNINNFYTFKKKVLEARELICSLNVKHAQNNEQNVEYVDEELLQMVELADEHHLIELVNDSAEDVCEKIESHINKPSKTATLQVTRLVKVQNVKKRPNESNIQETINKKPKSDVVSEPGKIIIQMNECLICPAILGDVLKLKDHIETHPTVKCKACGRHFARYSNLKRHFNSIHSKPKPFQCDLCGLGFNFSVNLQSHAVSHYSPRIRNE